MTEEYIGTKEHTEVHSDEIKTYRKLNLSEISDINKLKSTEADLIKLLDKIEYDMSTNAGNHDRPIDGRWLAIGKTDLQKGFMSVIRAIAQPK